ncbi:extracellular solute-binding protein [Pseudomonas typographi]|uniref:extracellular solute-binding protein n=1 Tax=Pseudomonas typographi TaxID=2715964 RepID=UPI0016855291|nr:extracellular solute-binding protein [Pseudomonas typographi]MBD1553045.1 extracellular solute-binding protein [Pseudomonas typographi]
MRDRNSKGFSRRSFLKGLGVAGLAAAAPTVYVKNAWAEGKSISVGTYKGTQAEYIRQQVIPKFESDFKCKVSQAEGSTLNQIAQLRIQKSNPVFSVMFLDDVGIPIARDEGLIAPLDLSKIGNSQRVAKRFVMKDNYAIAFCVSSAAPYYNTESAQPLTSYAQLWSEDFRGAFMMSTPKQTQGVFLPVVAAALVTGLPLTEAQYQISKAWDKMAELKPNVQTIYESNVTAVLQVSQGQAKVGGLELSKVVLPYTTQGAPVDLCYPKEGIFGVPGCMTLVNNCPNPDLALAFMDRMLDPEIQKGLAESAYAAPTVSGIELDPAVAKLLPYPEGRLDEMKLVLLDWNVINSQRSDIIERTNQIFGVRG